ncbi:MAG TPA: hypothetical protein VKK79_21080 [Candidatus Lokiarchaeia archaeon]|nr:hypothetical protein [Candidatus Lokiarchaeia archaeon]
MENSGDFFLDALYGLISKTVAFLKTHVPRYRKIWAEFYAQWEPNPQIIRLLPADKQKIYDDAVYRVEVLRTWENALVEGFYAIKGILTTTYDKILPDASGLEQYFTPSDVWLLGYRVAERLLGTLQRLIPLIPGVVPAKYLIVAKAKAALKISTMTDEEVEKSATASNIPCTVDEVRGTFAKLEEKGLVEVDRSNPDQEVYSSIKEFQLSGGGEVHFKQKFNPILEWGIQTWQSFYNVRELDVKIPDSYQWADHLGSITSRAATQGFTNAYFVIKNVANYFEALNNGDANPPPAQ